MISGTSAFGNDHYDAIVIGSGAAGLTCATTMAQAGLRVLLAEKNEWLGGYSHGNSQDGFHWDHGGHIFLAYKLGAQAREVFQRMKLDQRLEMVPDKHDYSCIFPDESLAIPADMTEAADIFASRFPEEREGIATVLQIMEDMIDEVDQYVPSFRVMRKPGERHLFDPLLEQFQRPTFGALAARTVRGKILPGSNLLKYQNKTLMDLLNDHLHSRRLKAYFSMMSAGVGLGPSRLSSAIAGIFFIHALRTQWMPKGGFGQLAVSLAELFEERGGTVVTGAEVSRITLRDGRASGVETADGRHYSADFVVSACDARRTFLDMLDPSVVPADLRQRLPKMDLTPSIYQVQLGVDMDLEPYKADIKRLNFIYPSDDIDQATKNFAEGKPEEAAFFLYVATFHQPEMAPPGKHSIKLESYTQLNAKGIDWERDKERISEIFIRRAETLIPNLGQHIVTKALRTPQDLANDTGNSEGAFAGWAFTPEFLAHGRPKQRTPVPGLYLAGHWTTPSAGVPWVMVSGFNTASMVIADRKGGRKLPDPRALLNRGSTNGRVKTEQSEPTLEKSTRA